MFSSSFCLKCGSIFSTHEPVDLAILVFLPYQVREFDQGSAGSFHSGECLLGLARSRSGSTLRSGSRSGSTLRSGSMGSEGKEERKRRKRGKGGGGGRGEEVEVTDGRRQLQEPGQGVGVHLCFVLLFWQSADGWPGLGRLGRFRGDKKNTISSVHLL